MKARYGLILCLILVTALTGCGDPTTAEKLPESVDVDQPVTPESVDVDQPVMSESVDVDQPVMPEGVDVDQSVMSEGVDVDLSVMSTTMVYSEVYNMMAMPETYVGKTIKMNGTCSVYHDENTNKDYYACIVKDATACCSQGIEFELSEKDRYPKTEEEITVVGTFQVYREGENTYGALKNARLM